MNTCNPLQSYNQIPNHFKSEKYIGEYIGENIPFVRIRRITGYLVGDINRWNDGKKAELQDRVKHY